MTIPELKAYIKEIEDYIVYIKDLLELEEWEDFTIKEGRIGYKEKFAQKADQDQVAHLF